MPIDFQPEKQEEQPQSQQRQSSQIQLFDLPQRRTFEPLPESKGPQGLFDNAMDFSMGLMGLPSARTEPSNAYGYGEMTQNGLPLLAGVGAGIYGLKKYLGSGNKVLTGVDNAIDLTKPVTAMEAVIPPVEQVLTPVQKLGEALKQTKPLNVEQKNIYSAERRKRLAQFKNKPVTSQADYIEQKKGLGGGAYEKVEMEPLKLNQPDVDDLFMQIGKHPKSIGFNQVHASEGLSKILVGAVPTESEVKQLTAVFGKDFIDVAGNLRKIDTRRNLLAEGVNLPRALMASFDMSAPLRQALPLAHRKEYRQAWDDMFKSAGSHKAFEAVQKNIESRPTFELMQESKLALTDLHNLSNREEAFLSNWGEAGIPLGELGRKIGGEKLGKAGDIVQGAYAKTAGRGVAASNRAYVGFLNKLRADTFDTLVSQMATARGVKPEQLDPYIINEVSRYINNATGRGSLGSWEKNADALNTVFFSPRLIASRLQMMNPNNYLNPRIPKEIRKEYLKSLISYAGVTNTVATMAALSGAATVDNNPTSSDFRKIRIGNTRLDPYGGHQQYIVAASRLALGESTSPANQNVTDLTSGKYGAPNRFTTLVTGTDRPGFLENKMNPVLTFATTMLRGKGPDGKPVNVSNEVASRFIPLIVQDLYELYQDDPTLMPAVAPAMFFGMGSQTFEDR